MSIWETFLIAAMAKDGEPGEAGCVSFQSAMTWSVRFAPRPPPASMWPAAFMVIAFLSQVDTVNSLYAETC